MRQRHAARSHRRPGQELTPFAAIERVNARPRTEGVTEQSTALGAAVAEALDIRNTMRNINEARTCDWIIRPPLEAIGRAKTWVVSPLTTMNKVVARSVSLRAVPSLHLLPKPIRRTTSAACRRITIPRVMTKQGVVMR